MYPVSLEYKNKIKENIRMFDCKIQIEHSRGTLLLDDRDLVLGSLAYTESTQSGEEFTVGGTVASDISFAILNKPEYENIAFVGATVFINIGLMIQEAIDAHFLQPSQPSKMKGFDGKWEYVLLGRFSIDDVNRQRNTIELKAIDNLIHFDKPYSLSKLSYPATLYQIYVNACNVCDVNVGTTNFINKDYIVQTRPEGDYTFRDIIGYVAELAGCFAKCNREGALELLWYTPTNLILEPSNRSNFKPSDDTVQIKGIMATVKDKTYLAGSEDYAIDLTENPLLQGNYETVLPNILANVQNTIFTPYTSDWQGNPALQAGDIITQIDRDGKVYNTLITKSIYKYRGRSVLEAKGLPEISRGYKGSTNKKIAEIKRKVEKEVGDKLTTLEQLQLNNTELIANMLGGYVIEEDNALYIADNENLELATKVWKWGLGGFGYSSTGKDGPYTTSITADGSIVAMLVAANIITANMVQTGILQSEDGSTWINLDDGSFNFKNQLKWYDGKLTFATPDERIVIGEHHPGKYGMRILGADGVTVIIDEAGIIQTDTIHEADNVDATHPLKLKFYIDDGVISVNKVKLAFSLEKFRAYETGAAAGGAQVNLELEYYELFTRDTYLYYYESPTPVAHNHMMDHTHKLNLPNHTHQIIYGIYEGTVATGVKVKVDGVERLNNGGSGYSTDQNSLDLTEWITTSGWHTIELTSTQLGRINASIYIKSFVGV